MFSIRSVAECFLGSDAVFLAMNYVCLQVKAIQQPCSPYPSPSSLSCGSKVGTEHPSLLVYQG